MQSIVQYELATSVHTDRTTRFQPTASRATRTRRSRWTGRRWRGGTS